MSEDTGNRTVKDVTGRGDVDVTHLGGEVEITLALPDEDTAMSFYVTESSWRALTRSVGDPSPVGDITEARDQYDAAHFMVAWLNSAIQRDGVITISDWNAAATHARATARIHHRAPSADE